MAKLNLHFRNLSKSYLFQEIERRIALLEEKQNPLVNLGIGDVTHPLFPCVTSALISASQEMGREDSFKGYGPSEGYLFLREKIAKQDYRNISPDEVFISDGANTDLANLQELFSQDNRVAVIDPGYPVYIDTNVMAGRTKSLLKTGKYGGIVYLSCSEANQFQPELPNVSVDLMYLCSPNNPTGVALTHNTLQSFVDYARKNNAVIIYDGAYEAFVRSGAPRSIYEIEGAKEVAIEVRSFSKSAGFTGLRCSYTIIPKELKVRDAGGVHLIHPLWKRRVDAKSNGVSYPIQKAAEALYSKEGQKEISSTVQAYGKRAEDLFLGLKALGYTVFGGIDSPYVWCKTPPKVSSWEFFDFILQHAGVVTIPGSGFGPSGEGFVRLSGFAKASAIQETLLRFRSLA